MATIRKTDYRLERKPVQFWDCLLAIDEVPVLDEGCFTYKKRKGSTAYYTDINGDIKKETEEKQIPLHQMEKDGSDEICNDSKLFNFLIKTVEMNPTRIITQGGELNIATLNYAFTIIESGYLLRVDKMIMHPNQYAVLRVFSQISQNNLYGYLWGAEICVSDLFPQHSILFLADPRDVGIVSVRDDSILAMNILDINSISMIKMAPTA